MDAWQLVAMTSAGVAAVSGGCVAYGQTLFAQADNGLISGETGIAMGIVAIITAIATGVIQPVIRERGTEGRLKETVKQIEDLHQRIGSLEAEIDAVQTHGLLDRERFIKTVTDLTARNLQLTTSNNQLSERNLSLIRTILVRNERHPEDEPIPTELLIRDGPPHPNGPNVLIVEDDSDAREAIRQILERSNFQVETTATLSESLVAINRNPEYVLLDLMLPDGDGTEVLREVRKLGLSSKVIVTTGRSEEYLSDVKALHPLAVFTKPVRFFSDVMPLLRVPES